MWTKVFSFFIVISASCYNLKYRYYMIVETWYLKASWQRNLEDFEQTIRNFTDAKYMRSTIQSYKRAEKLMKDIGARDSSRIKLLKKICRQSGIIRIGWQKYWVCENQIFLSTGFFSGVVAWIFSALINDELIFSKILDISRNLVVKQYRALILPNFYYFQIRFPNDNIILSN